VLSDQGTVDVAADDSEDGRRNAGLRTWDAVGLCARGVKTTESARCGNAEGREARCVCMLRELPGVGGDHIFELLAFVSCECRVLRSLAPQAGNVLIRSLTTPTGAGNGQEDEIGMRGPYSNSARSAPHPASATARSATPTPASTSPTHAKARPCARAALWPPSVRAHACNAARARAEKVAEAAALAERRAPRRSGTSSEGPGRAGVKSTVSAEVGQKKTNKTQHRRLHGEKAHIASFGKRAATTCSQGSGQW